MRTSPIAPFAVSAALRASRRWRRAPVRRTTAALASPPTNGPDEVASVTSRVHIAKSPQLFEYDLDGNLLNDGYYTFTYDSANRLEKVSTNGVLVLTNIYDAKSLRVRKVTPEAAITFFYDDWNLAEERVAYTNGATSTLRYYWGKDLSGTLQGAGGVGGLLYLTVDGVIYIPCYDNNGNITCYLDTDGNVVAEYTYNAFGNAISQSGPLADFFRHRFSTKYFDVETGFYYYGYRFYRPDHGRWLNRDPIGVNGDVNLYGFCHNNALCNIDTNGCAYVAYRRLDNPFNKLTGVVWSPEKECKNRVWAHQHIFFEDGKAPQNLGFFDDGVHSDDENNIKATWIKIRVGLNDACLRKAISLVRPLPYSLFGDRSKDITQYNCQDWVDDVLAMYDALVSGRNYYPKSTKFIGGR